MRLIVGLGNPGDKYVQTRHNVGFLFVDRLRSTVYSNHAWERKSKFKSVVCSPNAVVVLVKPQTFMNFSGIAVQKVFENYKLKSENLYVAHDDLDLKIGEYKIQLGKGPKVHGGINSIENYLGTKEFWRIRIGVDNRDILNRIKGEEYVLGHFSSAEQDIIQKVIEKVAYDVSKING